MNSERGVESRCGEYAEALDDAEVFGGHCLHSERADEHHAEGDRRAYPVCAAVPAFRSCGDDHAQRYAVKIFGRYSYSASVCTVSHIGTVTLPKKVSWLFLSLLSYLV